MPERRLLPTRSPLVGRDVEIERMQAALDEVMAGRGRLTLVSGEPGIGKTRLVEELSAVASAEGAMVAWGRVDDVEGAPPYSPWVQVLEALLDRGDPAMIREALGASAGTIAAVLPAVKELVTEIAPPPPLDAAAARFRLHEAIVDFLRRVGEHQRLVVVLDDMHWADVSSLELARFVGTRLDVAPLLLIVTYRTVDAGTSQMFDDVVGALARVPGLDRIELAGMSEPEVGRFIAQTIGMRPRPAAVASMHARTEGNPFFVGELARLLQSEGLLRATDASHPTLVPVGVRDVVRRRLVRLPEPTNALLVLGAVIGREFDLVTLAASAQVAVGDILDALEPALSAGLISEAGGPLGCLRFSHALIRDTVYSDLSALRQATLHARVGSAIEQRPGDARSHLVELAWHFFHAAPVVGPERGLTYTLEAAEAAQAALAYEQAEDDLRRALRLVDLLPPGRDRLERQIVVQNRLAMLLTTTRGYSVSETADAWARSRELYTELGDARELLMPLFGLFLVHSTRGDHRAAGEIGKQLLDLGDAVNDAALRLAGHDIIGVTNLYRGNLAEAREHLEQSMALSATFDDAALLQTFPMHPGVMSVELAIVYHLSGDEDRASVVRAEAKAVRDRLSQPLSVGPGLVLDLWLQGCRADVDTLPEDAAEASKLCRQWGLLELAAMADFWGASARQQRDGNDLTAELGTALAILETSGFRILRTQYLALLADAYRQIGDLEHALRLVDDGRAEAARNDELFWAPELLRLRGEILASSDPSLLPQAVESITEAVRLASAQGSVALQRRAERSLAALGPEQEDPASRNLVPQAPAEVRLFRKEGDFWTIAYEGSMFRLKDSKGLGYLAHLLARPRREVHVIDLFTGGESQPEGPEATSYRDMTEVQLDQIGLGSRASGDAGAMLDAQAKAAYKRRLQDLQEDLEEAQAFNDPVRAARAQAEIDALIQALAASVGLGGRDRKAASGAERARLNVTRAIKTAIERIGQNNPSLGQHLTVSVNTGAFCSYTPDPGLPATWTF